MIVYYNIKMHRRRSRIIAQFSSQNRTENTIVDHSGRKASITDSQRRHDPSLTFSLTLVMVQLRRDCVSCNGAHLWPRMPLRGMRNQHESPHLCRELLTINQMRIITEKAKISIIALSNKLKRNLHFSRNKHATYGTSCGSTLCY